MARTARVVEPSIPYHITQRGNRRQQAFFCDDDYRTHLGVSSVFGLVVAWGIVIKRHIGEIEIRLLLRQKRTGRPLGNERFIDRLKKALRRTHHK